MIHHSLLTWARKQGWKFVLSTTRAKTVNVRMRRNGQAITATFDRDGDHWDLRHVIDTKRNLCATGESSARRLIAA